MFRDADLDNAYITIGLDGAVATTHLSRTSKIGMDIRCEVIGPDGSIFLTQAPVTGEISLFARESARAFPADCRERFRDAYQAQIDDFGAACRGRGDAERDARGRPLGGRHSRRRTRQRRPPGAPRSRPVLGLGIAFVKVRTRGLQRL